MPQLGILFDTQELGTGFYGYTSFRILFSVLKTTDLAGCSLFHGSVEDESGPAYCIAVVARRERTLAAIRRRMGASGSRGLMPLEYRFMEQYDLEKEELAHAADISESSVMLGRGLPNWLTETWDRPQPEIVQSHAPAGAAGIPKSVAGLDGEKTDGINLPDQVPFPLWWSHHGRRAFALMLAFCCGGALLPFLGCGVSLCAMLAVAGAVQGIVMQWRLWVEQRISGESMLAEARKIVGLFTPSEICQRLDRPGPQFSPLLHTLQSVTRGWMVNPDAASMAAVLDQIRKSEEHMLRADLEELRFVSWGVPALAVCSFYAMQIFVGVRESWIEAPRLALAGTAGWLVLAGLRCSVQSTAERLYGDISRLTRALWLPALEAARAERPKSMSATA